jgi:hypothetical protein
MSRHPAETDLALFITADLSPWRRFMVRLHSRSCEQCSTHLQEYRRDFERRREEAAEMPPGIDWDRLSAEMTANIRVGLAAGECVAPRGSRRIGFGWRPAAVAAGVAVLLIGAWWLNLPASDTESLRRAMSGLVRGRAAESPVIEERGPVVEATSSGIELRENGGSLAISQGRARPVAITVNAQGSASAQYVDADTGQITITSVYVQ